MGRGSRKAASLVVGLVALALAGIGSSAATAAVITVANTSDSGAGSLRQAIAEAGPGDSIVLPASATHYAITSDELRIEKNLTITGAGARATVIDAMGQPHRLLAITAGTVAVSGVTITGARNVPGGGAGIEIEGSAAVTLSNVNVSGNTVETGGDGGGIEARSGTLTIDASTIAHNDAYNGGGLWVSSTTVITNSTIAGNRAGDHAQKGDGGGLQNNGSLTLANDTIAGNECFNGSGCGGAILGSAASVKNTIIAGNLAGDTSDEVVVLDNCTGTVTSTGPNLEDGSECKFAAHGGFSEANPLLTPLADNGGPTETMALLAGSPAIDHGTNEGCPASDQRGGARPQPPGGTCDIGAVEYGSLADLGVSQVASPAPVIAGQTLTYSLTVTNSGPGPDPAAGTTLADTLPAGASLISATPTQGSCSGSAPVSCALGVLASGASAHVTIVVRPGPVGTATNSATAGATPTDPNPANNLSQLQTTVVAPAPAISGLSETARTWREGNRLSRISAKRRKRHAAPVGTTFSFTLNVAARVTFKFTRTARGRRVGRRCLAQTRRNKNKRRCSRAVTAGTMTLSAHAGKNRVRFEGRISKHAKLKPGNYTLLVTATASGERSPARTLRFTILRG